MAMRPPRLLECLSEELVLALDGASSDVRQMVEALVSENAVARLLGLDAVGDVVLRHGELQPRTVEALPFLLGLATSPRYPLASALLGRLAGVLAAVDDPPRSASGEPPADPVARRAHALFEAHAGKLLRVARSSRDPESCRVAARMVSHFPRLDAEILPVFVALLSGARDADGRAPLLEGLARVRH
jgi:hypothetical protein